MAPKIDTSCSSTSGSGQNLRNARGSTQRGRYEQLKVARGRIQAAKQAKEAKKACSTRQAHTARQAPTVWSESDSDTPLSSGATAAPALANFAMIKAKGNATKYVNILNNLYKANGLQAPDFTEYLP